MLDGISTRRVKTLEKKTLEKFRVAHQTGGGGGSLKVGRDFFMKNLCYFVCALDTNIYFIIVW